MGAKVGPEVRAAAMAAMARPACTQECTAEPGYQPPCPGRCGISPTPDRGSHTPGTPSSTSSCTMEPPEAAASTVRPAPVAMEPPERTQPRNTHRTDSRGSQTARRTQTDQGPRLSSTCTRPSIPPSTAGQAEASLATATPAMAAGEIPGRTLEHICPREARCQQQAPTGRSLDQDQTARSSDTPKGKPQCTTAPPEATAAAMEKAAT